MNIISCLLLTFCFVKRNKGGLDLDEWKRYEWLTCHPKLEEFMSFSSRSVELCNTSNNPWWWPPLSMNLHFWAWVEKYGHQLLLYLTDSIFYSNTYMPKVNRLHILEMTGWKVYNTNPLASPSFLLPPSGTISRC